jgi:hypothetical protein
VHLVIFGFILSLEKLKMHRKNTRTYKDQINTIKKNKQKQNIAFDNIFCLSRVAEGGAIFKKSLFTHSRVMFEGKC